MLVSGVQQSDSVLHIHNLWIPKGKGGVRDILGVGINIYTLLYIK